MKYSTIKKYKYRLEEDEVFHTSLFGDVIDHQLFSLAIDGRLVVYKGYLWNGLSGPTWDTESSKRGSLGHDVKYQMIRLKLLPLYEKDVVDLEMKQDLIQGGVWPFRAEYCYQAVKFLGASSCVPGDIQIPTIIEV